MVVPNSHRIVLGLLSNSFRIANKIMADSISIRYQCDIDLTAIRTLSDHQLCQSPLSQIHDKKSDQRRKVDHADGWNEASKKAQNRLSRLI